MYLHLQYWFRCIMLLDSIVPNLLLFWNKYTEFIILRVGLFLEVNAFVDGSSHEN